MTKLSVNINKVALIRNSRGANFPNLIKVAQDCEEFGAQGITIHPRPDERHAKYSDVPELKTVVKTEFNVEGYPSERFLKMIIDNKPHQCTLVPDKPGALTSDNGWDTIENESFLKEIISELNSNNIRTSLFINPDNKMIEGAKKCGADRIEFYTGPYAHHFHNDKEDAIREYVNSAKFCNEINIGINAGHDLNLDNLKFFKNNIPNLLEVSIGHALVVDAMYYGFKNTIQMYLNQLK